MDHFKEKQNDEVQRPNQSQNKLGEHKEKKDRLKWQLPVALASFSILAIIIVLFVLPKDTPSQKGNTTENHGVSISYDQQIDTPEIPIIENTDKSLKSMYLRDFAMDRGRYDYVIAPLVMEPVTSKKGQIKRGQVIYYSDKNQMDHLSRIIGLPGETVEIEDGVVFINGKKLQTFYGSSQVRGAKTEEELKNIYSLQNSPEELPNATEKLHYSLKLFTLKENEIFVLPDNREYAEKTILKINDIDSIILGYENAKVQFTLNKKEEEIYKAFKVDFNQKHLKGLQPISIAKMYVWARIDNLPKLEYSFYTDRKGHIQWTLKEHIKDAKTVQPKLTRTERKLYETYSFNNIEKGKWHLHKDDDSGYISFPTYVNPNEETGFQMIRNKDGIWQVAFMPIQ
ncbi:S26 family signal peptidase [Viridibacillus sp. NPDC096237]|uniref:S26 family signal peptidase n=1 Tax=Viridibacillus sp. NPDC096237 TaxID=3390721 RepID=UPI003CFCE904